jgi:outer membrane receptor for ferrienterochelin and colicin
MDNLDRITALFKNTHRETSMFTNNKLSKIALAVALSVGLSTASMAQETSSAMEGSITTPSGTPAAGTLVTVVHLPSGTSRQTTVSETGTFTMRGLRVGGPYQIVVDSNQFQDANIDGVFLSLGEAFDVDLQLEEASDIEVISVNSSAVSTSVFGATGPQSIFSLEDLQNAPAINRDINDIVRADPRIFVDESSNDSVRCGGASPRFNSLTIDGVRLNDTFGLNSNGYPTTRIPFSFDALQEVAVELAPMDVEYGGFTACNINAVIKSGTNEITGGVFFDYTSDSFRGDTADDEKRDNGKYTEKRYGFNIGAPLIEDKLFIYAAYEKLEGAQLYDYNFGDGRVTDADISQITSVAQAVYGYDVGGTPASAPVEDEKVLIKLDWNINDDHRAALIYIYNDGFSLSQSDGGFGRVSLANHFYERGAELDSTVLTVYSNWTDDFSTEFRLGQTNLDNRQNSLDQASGFGEAQIRTEGRGTVFIGPDDSRQSNDLNWERLDFKFAGTYYYQDHKITAGIEYEEQDVFNLFMQHTVGEYRFDSIEDFELGTVNRIYYNNSAGTNNPADAGATFNFDIMSLYVQDEFYLTDDVQVKFGLRYESYSSGDVPNLNQNFTDRYGYSNQGNVDGISLLQPRVSFNWGVSEDLEIRGGIGLFSGGNPNVWISNAYSNDGVTNISTRERDIAGWSGGDSILDLAISGDGRAIYNPPQALVDIVAATSTTNGDGNVVATVPDFEIPSEWKYTLGATYIAPMDFIVTADLIFTDKQDSAIYRDGNLTLDGAGTGLGGRPEYALIDPSRRVGSDFVLGNVDRADGKSTIFSVSVAKSWDNGIDATFGYSYVQSEDANPMTSSVGFSNYVNFATIDPNNPSAATSDYEIPQRATLSLSYKAEFISGYETRFSLFGQASDGKPISYVMNQGNARDGFDDAFGYDTSDRRQLVYVPTGDGTDGVTFLDAADEAAFFAWADGEGFARGQNTSRNSRNADWWIKADIRVSQQIPGFMEGHKASAFLVIENFTNMLNDDWGDFRQGSFVGEEVIDVDTDGSGNYFYSNFDAPGQSISRAPSLWEVRVGVNYRF